MKKCEFNILLVDNDEMSLKSLSSFLLSEGYAVFSFIHPIKALESFAHRHYQILITDYAMPSLNGIQLIKQIKAVNSQIITILYTGYATQLFEQEKTWKQADFFFKKPLRIRKLIQIIDTEIEKHTLEEK